MIDGDLFHHIREVCRFQPGEEFELLPGDGRAVRVSVTSVDKRSLKVSPIDARTLPGPGRPHLTLALSIPKLPKLDWIIEKAVELGVSEVRPFVSDFSFLREAREISPARMARWQKLVVAATQQCGRGELMPIAAVEDLGETLRAYKSSLGADGLFAYEGEADRGLDRAVVDLRGNAPEKIWIFVGSEGGFSPRELDQFVAAELPPVSLGAQILRVETACVALISVLKYGLRGLS